MIEVAEVFHRFAADYLDAHGAAMPPSHRRAIADIQACRTEALGGHLWRCDQCAAEVFAWHSCKNRSCPKCHTDQIERWLEARRAEMLPVPYFHVVVTVPKELRAVLRANQRDGYAMLMKATAEAIVELARDRRHVGGTVGILAVLHTWTQQLHYHPHVHCLVTGGGISDDGEYWHPARKSFLVPMKALAKLVRGKLRAAFEKRRPDLSIPDATWSKPWVTQCTPWGEGEQGVLDYLARYVFRVAITNARIVGLDDRTVTIRCKDRRLNQWRTSRMPGDEFMRRFLQHVLPKGLHKVRYFGLWHPSHREQVARVRQLLWLDRLQPAGSKAARMPMARHSMARHSMARQLIARSPTNLAFVRIVEWGICCRSATLRRDGRKGHDIPRIRDSRKTGPAHARLNRATVPFDLGPMLVPPGAPQQVSSALPDGVQPQSQRSVGVKKAQSNAGSAPRQ